MSSTNTLQISTPVWPLSNNRNDEKYFSTIHNTTLKRNHKATIICVCVGSVESVCVLGVCVCVCVGERSICP